MHYKYKNKPYEYTTMLTNTYIKILIEARIISPYFQTILYRLDTVNFIVFLLI